MPQAYPKGVLPVVDALRAASRRVASGVHQSLVQRSRNNYPVEKVKKLTVQAFFPCAFSIPAFLHYSLLKSIDF